MSGLVPVAVLFVSAGGLLNVPRPVAAEGIGGGPNSALRGELAPLPPAITTGRWIEQGGVLVMEAENTPSNLAESDWFFRQDLEGYTGDGYVSWEGEDYIEEPGPPEEWLQFPFRINEGGAYWIEIRCYHVKDPSGEQHPTDGETQNDVWIGLFDEADTSLLTSEWPDPRLDKFFTPRVDQWDFLTRLANPEGDRETLILGLEEGNYRIILAPRDQFNIDRIHVTKGLNREEHENPDLPESNREGFPTGTPTPTPTPSPSPTPSPTPIPTQDTLGVVLGVLAGPEDLNGDGVTDAADVIEDSLD